MARKLAEGSLFTVEDQERLYREQMGNEKADKQVRAARLENKQCICEPRSVKRRWDGSTKATSRRVHTLDCPRHRKWMLEVFDDVQR